MSNFLINRAENKRNRTVFLKLHFWALPTFIGIFKFVAHQVDGEVFSCTLMFFVLKLHFSVLSTKFYMVVIHQVLTLGKIYRKNVQNKLFSNFTGGGAVLFLLMICMNCWAATNYHITTQYTRNVWYCNCLVVGIIICN